MNYRLKVMLSDSKIIVPNGIYFHLIVPDDITFLQLHKIIMAATNYLDYHLWTFMFKDNYEVKILYPDDDSDYNRYRVDHGDVPITFLDATSTPLSELFSKYKKCNYVYDFGDYNEFTITLKKTYKEPLVYGVMDHNGIFPPEDVGGIGGFIDFLDYKAKGKNGSSEEQDYVRHYENLGYKPLNPVATTTRIQKIIREGELN